jgi:hypothetical protein
MKYNKEISCNCFKWGREGAEGERWGNLTNVHYYYTIWIVTMIPPPTVNISSFLKNNLKKNLLTNRKKKTKNKTLGLDRFPVEFYQTVKEH